MRLEGPGAPRSAEVVLGGGMGARDREDVRWYLEDYLQYPVDPAPVIAGRVEGRLAELGAGLFREVFEADRDAMMVWAEVARDLPGTRIEVDGGLAAAGVPWELLRDPATDGPLALRAGAFVRTLPGAALPPALPQAAGGLRVLLVICRPGGAVDVPFRSVASHLVRLSRGAREAFDLDVLRPPTFAALARVLGEARAAGKPYQVVHFDGHGAWLDAEAATGAGAGGEFSTEWFSLVSPPREGEHGYLVFEDPAAGGGRQLVDGPALGKLLRDGGVPVLVLNACRSAHAGLVTEPQAAGAGKDAHGRVRAYGSLAQEVMDAGVAGVVAMAYNVYVVTAARFIGEVYAGLLAGQALGEAVAAARLQLAADPVRLVGVEPRPLQDWVVPVVYEATPLALRPAQADEGELEIVLDQAEAGAERAGLEAGLPAGPDAGFFGRDESLLALDRAFDTAQVVLLHAWAGAGKTTTAAEFARWYQLTGGTGVVLFASFEHHLTLARLLDQAGTQFGPALERIGVQWATLGEEARRDVALQVLAQVEVLWVWDNIEPVAGFPVGTPSAWTPAEQDELLAFLRDLGGTKCKVLLTSRRDERGWLGDLPARVSLPAMPMLERLELARAVAARQPGGDRAFVAVADWRPLLEFTQGNPLTITILTRQALRDHHTTPAQIQAFVDRLRAGAAQVTDDAAQGRSASLAASLDYGLQGAFTEPERAILALLALFQGFADTDALTAMGEGDDPVPAVAGLDRDTGIALLNKAAENGLLTSYGDGYYAVHPAIPWHLQRLFRRHHGPPGSPTATRATRAWTEAISALGNYYQGQYGHGHTDVIGVLGMEEANLLAARRHALANGWHDLIIGPTQGLDALYFQTGRVIEWRRLVDELIPVLTDPATGGPRPGLGQQWSILTSYQVRIADQARDWATARQLQDAAIAWDHGQAAAALTLPPDQLNDRQRGQIRALAVDFAYLGHMLQEQHDPHCVQPYQEAMGLCQRIGDRREEGNVAYHLGTAHKDISALRDLDQAERWYQRASELFGDHDILNQAIVMGQLGSVAYERFRDARQAGASDEELLGYLNAAADLYHQKLGMLPGDAINEHAVTHHQLGALYNAVGDTDSALGHYQKSIRYEERQNNTYGAGQSRQNAAIALYEAGRYYDGLLYARAALRDYQAVGPGAAADAEQARQLITLLEQEQAHEPPSTPSTPA